ncbi:hypothetical protein SAMN05421503_2198 [Terribacillus aidingensis]|uniref:DUF6985 domain-containing protein n=1 Tax=Terribacillus aidingensis TaxID=586416 RepID=A0A285P1I4_9BACI|nr:hypothetical protein [Terribacillus aidingensis]SNZ14016.1 hypothetical protein SAMN05421503_2198 [Terribacillus aidingensis]
MTKINDELFGELEYKNNFWRGEMTIKMFNVERKIILSVDAHEDADFSNIQRNAFRNFIQDMNHIMSEAEKEVYEYYSENVDEYREMLEDELQANKIAPKIDSLTRLAELVKPTELIVRRVRKNGKRRLGLLCDVSWDIEDGLGIKIEDEVVEEVGYQDIVL